MGSDRKVRRIVVASLGFLLLASAYVVGKTLFELFAPPKTAQVAENVELEEGSLLVEQEAAARAPASRSKPAKKSGKSYTPPLTSREQESQPESSFSAVEESSETFTSLVRKFFSSESTAETKSETAKKEKEPLYGGFVFAPTAGTTTTSGTTTVVTNNGNGTTNDTTSDGTSNTPTVNVQPPQLSSVTNGGFSSGQTASGYQVTATVGDPLSVVSGTTTSGNYKVLFNSSAQR